MIALIIVVGHAGDKLSFHSLHDGRILRTLPLNAPGTEITEERSIRDMWWLKHELRERSEAFKDVFNRKEVVRCHLLFPHRHAELVISLALLIHS